MKNPNCPICRSNARFEKSFDDIRLYRCETCDHCFTDVTHLARMEDYTSDYFEHKHRNWNDNPDLSLFDKLSQIIRKHKTDASVLDVGCGKGDFLNFLRTAGPQMALTGIDIMPGQEIQGAEVIRADFLNFKFPKQYDIVISLQAIEHMPDVQKFVHKLSEITKKDGLMIVSTVNDRSISYTTARLFNRLGYKRAFERLYSRHHLHHFNITSLKTLFERNGIGVKRILRHNEPIGSVDMPSISPFLKGLLLFGVWLTFFLGDLTGRTILQTMICQKSQRI